MCSALAVIPRDSLNSLISEVNTWRGGCIITVGCVIPVLVCVEARVRMLPGVCIQVGTYTNIVCACIHRQTHKQARIWTFAHRHTHVHEQTDQYKHTHTHIHHLTNHNHTPTHRTSQYHMTLPKQQIPTPKRSLGNGSTVLAQVAKLKQ